MERAKSRLKHRENEEKEEKALADFMLPSSSSEKPFKSKQSTQLFAVIKNYLKHIPTLVVGLVFWSILGIIMANLQPTSLRDILLPNTYLPFLIVLALALFFTSSFVLLHSRRGLLFTTLAVLFVFLRVQQVQTPLWFAPVTIFVFVAAETLLTFIDKNLHQQNKKS